MLAARVHTTDPHQITVETVPDPQPGPHDVVVRVESAGIVPGIFRLLADGRIPLLPTTLGHEIAGTVDRVGAEVTGVRPGQRVSVHPNLTCRSCGYCQTDREQMCPSCSMIGHAVFGPTAMPLYGQYHDGGFAELVKVPEWTVEELPDTVAFDVGAKVHDLANGLRALKLADLSPGATLVVTAATGTMGAALVRLAPLFGVTRIVAVGRSSARLAATAKLAPGLVEGLGLDTLDADWETTGKLTPALLERIPGGADAVVDFFPQGSGTSQSLAALRTGGTLVHMGANSAPIGVPALLMSVRCWRFVGSRNCTREDVRQVTHLLGTGALHADDLITHTYPLHRIGEAVAALLSRSEAMMMTVVHPQDRTEV